MQRILLWFRTRRKYALVERFRKSAVQKEALLYFTRRDVRVHAKCEKEMRKCAKALLNRDQEWFESFRNLMFDSEPAVRLSVATEFLSRGDTQAKTVLEDIRDDGGLTGYTAKLVLYSDSQGSLKSPFRMKSR